MALAVVQSNTVAGSNVSSVAVGPYTVTAGNLLSAFYSEYNAAGTFSSIAGSVNGTLTTKATTDTDTSNGSAVNCRNYYKANISGGSETITATLSGNGYPTVTVTEISGAATASPLDLGSVSQPSTTTTPSITAGSATAQADEIIFGAISQDVALLALTMDSNYTEQFNNFPAGGSITHVALGTRIVSSTLTPSFAPTLGVSEPTFIAIWSFKAAAGGGVSGSAAWTETKDTWAGAGAVAVSGTAAWTEAKDTWAGAGAVAVSGTAAWTEVKDNWAGAGAVAIAGTAAWTEVKDTWALAGSVITGASGSVAWTEAVDIWAGAGAVAISGVGAWTETRDTWAVSGSIALSGITGAVSWTELTDLWAGVGANGVIWTPVTPGSQLWTAATPDSSIWTPATLHSQTWTPQ